MTVAQAPGAVDDRQSYEIQIAFKSPPSDIYRAIATEDGVRGWLTTDCEIGDSEGATAIFRFGKTRNVIRVDKLDADREIRWTVVEQYLHAPGEVLKTDEWEGTVITFHLYPTDDGGTRLEFRHQGLTPELECYDLCNIGWDRFLKSSLPGFVDEGKCGPWVGGA